MRKVWYHQIWIQTYLGFIVSDLTYIVSTYMQYSILDCNVCTYILLVHHISIILIIWGKRTKKVHHISITLIIWGKRTKKFFMETTEFHESFSVWNQYPTDHENCIEKFFGQIDMEKSLFGSIFLVINYCLGTVNLRSRQIFMIFDPSPADTA